MPVTQKQIANELGISHQLVSFALNGSGNVAPKTREEIMATAERLGYRRNELARAIVTGKSRVVAVLTHEHAREHLAAMLAGTLGEITKQGYAAKILHLSYGEEDEAKLAATMKFCTAWRVDGVIALSLQTQPIACLIKETQHSQLPVVCVESSPADAALCIHSDDESGIAAALDHLGELGHRRIGLLAGAREDEVCERRAAIFKSTLQGRGWPFAPELIGWAHWLDTAVMEAVTHQILDLPDAPTALLGLSDSIAMVATRVARARGLSVPRDLSVIGYGNSSPCVYLDPPLSSIAQPFLEMGQIGARRLLNQIETKHESAVWAQAATPLRESLREQLIVRKSTAPRKL